MKQNFHWVALLILIPFASSAFALGNYNESWWQTALYPDFASFLHMVAFAFWWALAGIPAFLVAGIIIFAAVANR